MSSPFGEQFLLQAETSQLMNDWYSTIQTAINRAVSAVTLMASSLLVCCTLIVYISFSYYVCKCSVNPVDGFVRIAVRALQIGVH